MRIESNVGADPPIAQLASLSIWLLPGALRVNQAHRFAGQQPDNLCGQWAARESVKRSRAKEEEMTPKHRNNHRGRADRSRWKQTVLLLLGLTCASTLILLSEMTVGLIGYGQIGTRLAKLLKPFGCKILVNDPYVRLSEQDRFEGIEQVSPEQLLKESDVVSLHSRVTPETMKLIGRKQFATMKPGAYFINTARGPLVDYDALYAALTSSHLRGAMLDTFAIEPVPSDWPLLQLPNVMLTPHIAGASIKTVTIAARAAAEEVRRYFSSLPPLNAC
jgi:phosphoglycerate dehydrogenase-like enzyme